MHARWLWLTLALLGAACGPAFDDPSEVISLRVLGVRKDQPFPRPGATVNLSMLWHDGRPDSPAASERAPAQVIWFPPCANPPGDRFYGCFEQLPTRGPLEVAATGALEAGQARVAEGDSASVVVPSWILDGREVDVGQPKLGLTFVFFAACAGRVSFEPPRSPWGVPLACRDGDGVRLGDDAFVVGYVTLYTYEAEVGNQNPQLRGFEVGGRQVPACVDEECGTTELAASRCQDAPERCVAVCADDGADRCPAIHIRPLVEPKRDDGQPNAEPDQIAASYFQREQQEQLWINYYVDRGSVRSPTRLLNDSQLGWIEDHAVEYYAPKAVGPVTLWAVVHDSRGGSAWTRTELEAQ